MPYTKCGVDIYMIYYEKSSQSIQKRAIRVTVITVVVFTKVTGRAGAPVFARGRGLTNVKSSSIIFDTFPGSRVAGLLALFHATGVPASARTGRANLVYILNNNPAAGQNAVLGYSRNADGTLVDLAGSPFFTGGTGYRNTNERIGPDDTDGELIVSADKQFLFAVNEGSDSVAVFRIRLDGSLRPVQGSPFSSGGKEPCSLAVAGDFLYVVNRGDGILPTADIPT